MNTSELVGNASRRAGTRLTRGLLAGLLVAPVLVGLGGGVANADEGQFGGPMVELNPGGGAAADGTDGLHVYLNIDDEVNDAGEDQVIYRDEEQYCCGAVAPSLNIGGQLVGQAGAASYNPSQDWDSITLLSSSGSASVTPEGTYDAGAASTATGDAAALLRYTTTVGGLVYTLDRSVSYTFPNDYFTDSYSVTIPTGNTADVVLYQGGDTSPGGEDEGYGILLEDPAYSIISLNPSEGVLIGYRQVPSSPAFDGATSQEYDAPYDAVTAGEDIGFVVDTNRHDAGLMVQWNLGTAAGTYNRALDTFVNLQGTNLSASFRQPVAQTGESTLLDFDIVNTFLTDVTGLGFTFELPAGLVVGSTAPTNTCGGTLTATAGSTTITLTGGTAAAAANCVLSIPVVATSPGTFTITGSAVTSVTGLTSVVGTSSLAVEGAVVPPVVPPVTPPAGTPTAAPVVLPVAAPAAPVLANTGADTTPMLLLGGGLLIIGAGALTVTRRRHTV